MYFIVYTVSKPIGPGPCVRRRRVVHILSAALSDRHGHELEISSVIFAYKCVAPAPFASYELDQKYFERLLDSTSDGSRRRLEEGGFSIAFCTSSPSSNVKTQSFNILCLAVSN